MKKLLYISLTLFMYVLAYLPVLLRQYCPPEYITNPKIFMLFEYAMALTTICLFFSMLALVLRWHKAGLIISLIPIFIEAVVVCSVYLLVTFKQEIISTVIACKAKAVGTGFVDKLGSVGCKIMNVFAAPFRELVK